MKQIHVTNGWGERNPGGIIIVARRVVLLLSSS